MVKMVEKEASESGDRTFVIKGAQLLYTQCANYGGIVYGKKPKDLDKEKPWMHKQYETQLVVTKEILKQLKKAHKKMQAKDFDAEDFKKNFKVDPPFEADEYHVIRVARKAFKTDGDAAQPPRVFGKNTSDNMLETLIGNGSVGTVKVRVYPWENDFGKGTSITLDAIRVTDLVEYSGGGANDDDMFDDDEEDIDADMGDDFDDDDDFE